ncbi:MAG: 30S ribosomal protein S20 [Planctomycetota bacterium]|nr:30S ribosomal protein S20 [Planctomycetota bacterium]
MAHSKQANKRIRTSEKKRVDNTARMSRMKTETKKLHAAVAEGDKAKAQELLTLVCSCLDKAAKQNVIHRHTASRRKGPVMKAVHAMS